MKRGSSFRVSWGLGGVFFGFFFLMAKDISLEITFSDVYVVYSKILNSEKKCSSMLK